MERWLAKWMSSVRAWMQSVMAEVFGDEVVVSGSATIASDANGGTFRASGSFLWLPVV